MYSQKASPVVMSESVGLKNLKTYVNEIEIMQVTIKAA